MEDISNNSTAAVSEAVEEKTNEVVDTTVANEQAETPATEDIVLVENAEQVITTSEQPETNSVLIFVIAIVAAIIITFLIVRIIKSKKKAANNKGKKKSCKSKGYGFVEMPHRTEAEEAIRALNNKEIKGRKIHVNEARTNTRQTNR